MSLGGIKGLGYLKKVLYIKVMEKETLEETNMDKFLKLVSDEKSTWIEDLEHYNKNKEELDANFEAELNDLITTQEALEEAAERYAEGKSSSSVFQEAHIIDFIQGAKWQQERMYSEEEVEQMINSFEELCYKYQSNKDWFPSKKSEWFEQFKKK